MGFGKRERARGHDPHGFVQRKPAAGKGPSTRTSMSLAGRSRVRREAAPSEVLTLVREGEGGPDQPDEIEVMLGGSGLRIAKMADEGRFAHEIIPRESPLSHGGAGQYVVRIVATPGVLVEPFAVMADESQDQTAERRLVPEVIRVQDPVQVPAQGPAIDLGQFIGQRGIWGTDPREPRSGLVETRGRRGVTVRENSTGATLRLYAADSAVGARFAYEIVARGEGWDSRAQIRALVGPGTVIEVTEPVIRPPVGAELVDTFGARNVEGLVAS